MDLSRHTVATFSAIHCLPRTPSSSIPEKCTLRNWTIEPDPNHHVSLSESLFNLETGEYTTPIDGLYSLIVQLIPVNGANTISTPRQRNKVKYVLHITKPSHLATADDAIISDFHDIGSINYAQLVHLAAGSRVSCLQMPGTTSRECVRLKLELIQRKRKRPNDEDLSASDLQKRKLRRKSKKLKLEPDGARDSRPNHERSRHHTDDSDNDSGSDWDNEFDSDAASDDLPHSKRGVGRLAKRLKTATTTGESSPSS